MTASDDGETSVPATGLLAALSDEARERLVDGATRVDVPAGEIVVRRGDAHQSIYIVESGSLRATVPDRHGGDLELARLGQGEFFGEMSFFTGEPISASIEAVTASVLLRIPHRLLAQVADGEPALLASLASAMASRLRVTNDRLGQLRSGRTALFASAADTHDASAFVQQVALSAAHHLVKPVLLIDQGTAAVAPLSSDVVSMSLAEAAAAPDSLVQRGGTAEATLTIVRSDGDGASAADVQRLFHDMRAHYELVLVHATPASPIEERTLWDFGRTVHVIEEGGPTPPAGPEDGEVATAYLAKAVALPTVGAARAASALTGREVRRVVPGVVALGQLRPAEANVEPWRAVDYFARHVIARTVGLALGAGGSKGYAHIGVLRVLRDLGVPVDYVGGTSLGAPVAAAIADDWSTDRMHIVMDAIWASAIRYSLPFSAFLSQRGISKELQQSTGDQTFEDLAMPLTIVTADMESRSEVVFTSGRLHEPMLASMAIPVIYPPVVIDGRRLVDGAILTPIPIRRVAELGADVVIAIRLTSQTPRARGKPKPRRFSIGMPPVLDSVMRVIDTMQWRISAVDETPADVNIEPVFEGPTGLRDHVRGPDFIAAGEQAAYAARPALADAFPWID